MRDWYAVSTVRTGAPAVREPGDGLPFSPSLLPHLALAPPDPEVMQALLRRALARYLDATCALEVGLVNPVVARIASGALPLSFDDEVRLDAHRIYCDEGYHALQAAELRTALAADLPRRASRFLARLEATARRHPAEDRPLIELLAVVVSETLLSSNLRTLASDPRLMPCVRTFVADHARDESWHGTFFAGVFAATARQLGPADRERLIPSIPELVVAFLEPDDDAVADDLAAVGCAGVVPPDPPQAWRIAARPTVACVARAGAMHGSTAAAFARLGLVEG